MHFEISKLEIDFDERQCNYLFFEHTSNEKKMMKEEEED